jgi:hypothetical protein
VTGGREPGYWSYTYNEANQLVGWQKLTAQGGTVLKTATLTYDSNGNRDSQVIRGSDSLSGLYPPAAGSGTTTYTWDTANKLTGVTLPDLSQ